MSRILVTGSRDWTDWEIIEKYLAQAYEDLGGTPTLVSGACPTGADYFAEIIWERFGLPVERHPADWSRGRKAGPERNGYMVSLGADLCLAFIGPCTSSSCTRTVPHPSHGATGCALLAEQSGIKTLRVVSGY